MTTALVTGAGRGLGLEVCRQLVQQGMTVWGATRSPAPQVEEAGAQPLLLDVADYDSVRTAVAQLEELDVLVNNAAAYVDWSEAGSAADLHAARAVFETNVFGPWALVQAALPLLRRSSAPRIVNVSSGAGSHGDADFGLARRHGAAASYGVSKAALNALTATLAAELDGVLVNAVCPGLTATYEGAEAMDARPVEESAKGIVWAATLPDGGHTGGFFRDGQPHPW